MYCKIHVQYRMFTTYCCCCIYTLYVQYVVPGVHHQYSRGVLLCVQYDFIPYYCTYSSTRAVYTVYTAEYVYSMYAVSTVFYYRYDMQKYAKEYAVRQKTRYYLLLFCKRLSWSFRSVIVYQMYNFSWHRRICAEKEFFRLPPFREWTDRTTYTVLLFTDHKSAVVHRTHAARSKIIYSSTVWLCGPPVRWALIYDDA